MRKYYFLFVSILILFLSLIGFSDNLITDTGQASNSDPKFVIHGIFWFLWMLFFVIQTNFVRAGNLRAHRSWGVVGCIIAVGVVVSTLYVFFAVYKGWDAMPYYAKANRFFLPSFALLIVLGYINRKKPVLHKRFMYVATLLILEPILSRVEGNIGLDLAALLVIWNAMFLSLFFYDWITLRRIHPVTYLTFAWFYLVWTLCVLVL